MFLEGDFYSEVDLSSGDSIGVDQATNAACYTEESTMSNATDINRYLDADLAKTYNFLPPKYTPPPSQVQQNPDKAPADVSSSSSAERRKRAHNIVERRYRESLNKKFSQLKDILGTSSERVRKSTVANLKSTRCKRAQILDNASQRILELQEEVGSLKVNLQALREATLSLETRKDTLL